ncbi:MAG TPA: sigma-70 family RNA polymerase sigma factor [Candidatus Saccharimonadales bacterium]|nr:sigma-70 family RNA polymerase sigma factor [Candidatus Saccharimonadales bacterium]
MDTLIDKILSGNPQAVVDFYNFYAPKILRYLTKKLPHKEDAQEIANDVFLEAIDSLALLEKRENIQAWLFKIAHNKMVDYYRKKKIKSLLLSQVPYLEIVANEIHQPEFQFEKDKIRDKIEMTLHQLSEKYQKILRMHYEENVPVKEIAAVFNLSYKAAESLLFRARKEFQYMYERA